MPTPVERGLPPSAVVHATEYSPDRESRHRDDNEENTRRDQGETSEQINSAPPEDPAFVVDDHHHEDTALNGVAAYRATAKKVMTSSDPPLNTARPIARPEPQAAETIRHAYEDHGGVIERHAINVAT